LWFFGKESKVCSVYAAGITAVEPDLQHYNDRDNAVFVVKLYVGHIVYFYAFRMMAAGQDDGTESIGTRGMLSVNLIPVPVVLSLEATAIRIGAALQHSMIKGDRIIFDRSNERGEVARL
jgi:myo-inositol 2-dehydrogenase/D-chiro-inositol 1-dehydrogenase